MEKELLCLLPCLMAGRVAIGHPMCIVNVPHVMVIICHNCRLYHVPEFIMIIAFCGWTVNICQEAHSLMSLHTTAVKSHQVLNSNVTMFQSVSWV